MEEVTGTSGESRGSGFQMWVTASGGRGTVSHGNQMKWRQWNQMWGTSGGTLHGWMDA